MSLSRTARAPLRRLTATAAVLLGASVFAAAAPAAAAQAPVGLGTADSFAVLAGSGITNTGPTTITGDVGTFPTPTETGFGSVTLNGTNHAGDAVTQDAKDDLVAAYNDAAGRGPVTNVATELGGTTLQAGVYTSPTLGLTGTLTLDAQGNTDAQFIFMAGSTLIAEVGSRVLLLNGADPCRVVWQVGSSATFKTDTQFVGDVLAHMSITAQTRATFEGRLLARDGAVTLDTNTITKTSCIAPNGAGATTSADRTTATATPTQWGITPASSTGLTTATPTAWSTPALPSTPAPSLTPAAPATPAVPSTPAAPSTPAVPSAPAAPSLPPLAETGLPMVGLTIVGLLLVAIGKVGLVVSRRDYTEDIA